MAVIWKHAVSLENLNMMNQNTLGSALDIRFTEMGDDFVTATMPVNASTVQPFRILHGGASVALAETLGSVASTLCIENHADSTAVGLEINANHISSVRDGYVYGTARPIHIGKSTHVWDIRIESEAGKLVCVSRLTLAVRDVM